MLGKFVVHCEDSLTAAVFSHLLHLPVAIFWQILRDACYGTGLPAGVGEPKIIALWPKWDPQGTRNSSYVEPDLFLRFDDFDLIIEAKRWDEGMQSRNQWEDQLIAYANEYGEEKRTIRIIALGGLRSERSEELVHEWRSSSAGEQTHRFVCPVLMCRWRGLLREAQRTRRKLARPNDRSPQICAHARILDDVIHMFGCHGYSTGKWFTDFRFDQNRLSSYHSHLPLFRNRIAQLAEL